MRNGRYDPRGLEQVNHLLRDWRRNEPAKMNPKLLDLLWEVYRSVGARDYIHVVSAYRSPATNNMLRGRSSGVAENSQHTRGNAIDFFIPGIQVSKIRAAGFRAEGGGVGFYPKSGSPFVHLDVGNVRSWPRMNRNELMALFPDGRTIHVPSDGKPLPGYQQAMAAYKSRQRSGATVQIASASPAPEAASGGSGGGLLSGLFGNRNNNASAPEPAPAPQRTAAPQRAAPQPAAPVQQPIPQATPEAIIAALPARSVPLPGSAPRPMVDVGAAATPLIAGLPAQQQPEPAVAAVVAPVEVAVNVPIPAWRPEFTPAPAVAEPTVAVAAVELPATADLPISAIAGERSRSGGADAISDMLASSAADARADVVFNAPVPSLRPRLSDEGQQRQVAALAGEQSAGDVFVLASLPSTSEQQRQGQEALRVEVPESTELKQTRMAALSASPRVAVIGREAGSDVTSALDSGVRTTTKSAKPRAGEARTEPRSVAVPVEEGLTRWAFVRDVTVSTAGGTTDREQAYNTVWSAPQTVYTAGFQQGAADQDANRFTGKAVRFMSVARFATN